MRSLYVGFSHRDVHRSFSLDNEEGVEEEAEEYEEDTHKERRSPRRRLLDECGGMESALREGLLLWAKPLEYCSSLTSEVTHECAVVRTPQERNPCDERSTSPESQEFVDNRLVVLFYLPHSFHCTVKSVREQHIVGRGIRNEL